MAEPKVINVALVGAGFMGKAHSNAYLKVGRFFDLPVRVVMHTLIDTSSEATCRTARRWGWLNCGGDISLAVDNHEIDLVDVCVPNSSHAEVAIAAAQAGKAVACEKPLAHTLADARRMARAIARAKVPNFVWFNYRRAPAVALARQIIDEGRIGKIFHMRASYLQDWLMRPDLPLVWRLDKKIAGGGTLGDLAAHSIDLGRYLVGEFGEVVGHMETFIKRRPLPSKGTAPSRFGKVTVDDATMFLARFANGAVGTFESSRFCRGRKNANQFEINGEKGSIIFNFERMNELQFFDGTEPAHLQGFRRIQATHPSHPYMHAWWPPGHIIGYEHCAINQLADMLTDLATGKLTFRPDFQDGVRCQEVLEAVERSQKTRRWVRVRDV